MRPTAEATPDGALITGMRDLPGWSVHVNSRTHAVTLIPPIDTNGRPAEVDSTVWRKVPLGAVLREADALAHGEVLDVLLGQLARGGGDPSRSSRGGKRAHLQRVARVYRLAIEHGVSPQDALWRHFDADSPRTTQRWITDARKAGLIGTYAEERARIDRAQRRPAPFTEAEKNADIHLAADDYVYRHADGTPATDREAAYAIWGDRAQRQQEIYTVQNDAGEHVPTLGQEEER